MKLLSRTDEFVLLAVMYLKDLSYAVQIRKRLKEITDKTWSYGALFISLERLVKKDLLNSYLTEPLNERGGRRKRIYTLTPEGEKALLEVKRMENVMWDAISETDLGSRL